MLDKTFGVLDCATELARKESILRGLKLSESGTGKEREHSACFSPRVLVNFCKSGLAGIQGAGDKPWVHQR